MGAHQWDYCNYQPAGFEEKDPELTVIARSQISTLVLRSTAPGVGDRNGCKMNGQRKKGIKCSEGAELT